MNRNVFIGIIVLLILGSMFSYKFYIFNKNEVLSEYEYIMKLKKRIKEINYLKKENQFNINSLKKYCEIKTMPTKYILKCSNLDRNKFLRVQEIFKKVKLSKFIIEKNQNINVFVEIIK